MLENYTELLENLKNHSHFRDIKDFEGKDEKYIYYKGQKLLNLSSNNYLGFADNKNITEEFLNYAGDKYSFGSASARLLTGSLPVYKELEELISTIFNKERTLLFNSGYHANVGINSSIAGKGDVIFSDKLNHASIIDGMRLCDGKFFRYPHKNIQALEKLLIRERKNFNNAVIVSESVFSMDGDIADLQKLVELKEKYNCILILDEAHAFGVFGKNGLGVTETLGITDKVDLIVGTFGKAIGSMGAFVTGKNGTLWFLHILFSVEPGILYPNPSQASLGIDGMDRDGCFPHQRIIGEVSAWMPQKPLTCLPDLLVILLLASRL